MSFEEKENQKSILDQWLSLNDTTETDNKDSVIQPKPVDEPALLSSGQERLWFLQELFPNNPFYHLVDILRFRGELDQDILIQSIYKVAERHHSFATTFTLQDGRPIQVIGDKPNIEITQHNLQLIPEQQREKEAHKLGLEKAREPFDLQKGPLTRLMLMKLNDQNHLMLLSMHHIISDNWSTQLFKEELLQAYQALKQDQVIDLPKVPIQYVDYAFWDRNQKAAPEHLEYWKNQLSGSSPLLDIPADFLRPSRPSFSGGYISKELSPQLTQGIKQLCKETNSTTFALLLTAYKILLYRYTGQKDILVGSPFTNRDELELEKIIGFFNNTLVLRTDLNGSPSFLEVLERVKRTVFEAFAHKNYPFEELVQELNPERIVGTNPLFQVMFLYKNRPDSIVDSDLTVEHNPFDAGICKFDLTLYIEEEPNKITTLFEYTKDLFKPATIDRMHQHLQVLLDSITKDPNQKIEALSILPIYERKLVVNEWNTNTTPLPKAESIHQLIEEQAQLKPNQKAVAFQDQYLSYEELIGQSNKIVGHLQSLNIAKNEKVGLCIDRSVDMIVGIVGILRSGAAYIPLDPEYPAERIEFVIKDAGIPIILTQRHLLPRLANISAQIICLEDLIANESYIPSQVTRNDLAYIIYTSGSTGKPKGVPISHKNLIHSTVARFHYYPNSPESFLLLSSYSFDSSVAGIFWTLCTGGTLVIAEKRIEQDIDHLAATFAKHQITHTLLLPSLYNLLLQYAAKDQLSSLNTVIVAGEHALLLCVNAISINYLPSNCTMSMDLRKPLSGLLCMK